MSETHIAPFDSDSDADTDSEGNPLIYTMMQFLQKIRNERTVPSSPSCSLL